MTSARVDVSVQDIPSGRVLLDVRREDEWNAGHAPGALHIPIEELPARYGELQPGQPYAVICHSGGRSARATAWLAGRGFDVVNVTGGMEAWAGAKLPVVS